jgi:hypothetical protein
MESGLITNWYDLNNGICGWEATYNDDINYFQVNIEFDPDEKVYTVSIVEDEFQAVFETTNDYKRIYSIVASVTWDNIIPPTEDEFQDYCKDKNE